MQFIELLLNACQRIFFEQLDAASAEGVSSAEARQQAAAFHDKQIGIVRFLAELYNKGVLPEKIAVSADALACARSQWSDQTAAQHVVMAHLLSKWHEGIDESRVDRARIFLTNAGYKLSRNPESALLVATYFEVA